MSASLEQDSGERALAIEAARSHFLANRVAPKTSQRSGVRVGAVALVSAAAVALAVWALLPQRAEALKFEVDGAPGALQTWLAAPSTRGVVVSFSDGSALNIERSSRARVVAIHQHGAEVSLESGSIHGSVAHDVKSDWRLAAGPFAVRVTGTRFDVDWDPRTQQLGVLVEQGSVIVSGSILGSGRAVQAGQRLVASIVEGKLELTDAHATGQGTAHAASAPATPALDAQPAQPNVSAPARASGSAKAAAAFAWRELAKSGDLRGAFAAAEAEGFKHASDSASSSELLMLGDGARLSGRADRATQALLSLRQRFPSDSRRAAAAFALGKVAFDQTHAYAQAARWFATCLQEAPGGPLAREASGRRVEALRNAGDAAGARQAAQDYVKRYPEGPHADVARALLK